MNKEYEVHINKDDNIDIYDYRQGYISFDKAIYRVSNDCSIDNVIEFKLLDMNYHQMPYKCNPRVSFKISIDEFRYSRLSDKDIYDNYLKEMEERHNKDRQYSFQECVPIVYSKSLYEKIKNENKTDDTIDTIIKNISQEVKE
jgi:hypothetical protein